MVENQPFSSTRADTINTYQFQNSSILRDDYNISHGLLVLNLIIRVGHIWSTVVIRLSPHFFKSALRISSHSVGLKMRINIYGSVYCDRVNPKSKIVICHLTAKNLPSPLQQPPPKLVVVFPSYQLLPQVSLSSFFFFYLPFPYYSLMFILSFSSFPAAISST